MKKLLLSSDAKFVVEKGLKLLLDDISKIKLAYVTIAAKGTRSKEYIERSKEMLEKAGCDFEELDIEGKMKTHCENY